MMMHEDKFSSREVIVLIEQLRSEFRIVSEVVLGLREDITDLKNRVGSLEIRVASLEDAFRGSVPELFRRVKRLEDKVGVN